MKKSELQDLFKHLDKKDCDFLLSFAPSKLLDIQDAQLRLEFLKESFDYIDFFEKFKHNSKEYLTINETIKKAYPSTRKITPLFTRDSEDTQKYLGDYFNEFGLNPQIEKILWFLGWPFSDFLTLFDPQKTFADATNIDIVNALPIILTPCGIRRGSLPGYPVCYVYDDELPTDTDKQQLKPYEHLLVVDMRKRKAQLVEEFKQYIENEYRIKSETTKPFYKSDETYLLWEPTKDRTRKEAKEQLQVWKMRKQRYGYDEIGKKLSIKIDTARKAFYKAFERTQGKPFDLETSQELLKDIEVSPPTEKCTNCPDRMTCLDMCPDVSRYVDQDDIYLREKQHDDDYDDDIQKSDKKDIVKIAGEKIYIDDTETVNDSSKHSDGRTKYCPKELINNGGKWCPHCKQEDGINNWMVQKCDRCHSLNPDYRKES